MNAASVIARQPENWWWISPALLAALYARVAISLFAPKFGVRHISKQEINC
jgi:hypothetical protein